MQLGNLFNTRMQAYIPDVHAKQQPYVLLVQHSEQSLSSCSCLHGEMQSVSMQLVSLTRATGDLRRLALRIAVRDGLSGRGM